MSGDEELLDYITRSLESLYICEEVLRHTPLSEITVYCHRESAKKLLLRRSRNGNDEVYRILMPLRHPGLPQIYEVASCDEELVVLEEYIEGEALADRLENGPLPKTLAYRLVRQLCRAAGVLHRHGIVHRDIKPANILLCDGGLKLIDFNISRLMRSDARADTLPFGSVGYAPPEQFGLAQTGPASDIYAIGVVFNEMLTGHPPAVELAPGYAGRIIRRCVRTNASDRYQNVTALLRALRLPL